MPADLKLTEELTRENLTVKTILDPSFEEGGLGWHCYDSPTVLEIVKEPVSDGEKALLVRNRKLPWHGAVQDMDGFFITKGKGTYDLGADVQATAEGQEFGIQITVKDMGKTKEFRTEPVRGIPGKWVRVTGKFPSNWEDWIETATMSIREISGGT